MVINVFYFQKVAKVSGFRIGDIDDASVLLVHLSDLIPDQDYLEEFEPDNCQIRIVESIPEGLTYNGSDPEHLSTYKVFLNSHFRILSNHLKIIFLILAGLRSNCHKLRD